MPPQSLTYAQRFFEASLDLFEQGQHAKALEAIQKAIDKSPNNPDYRYTRATYYHKMNNLVMAVQGYHETLELAPNYKNAHFNLGLIHMKGGKIADAIRCWEAVIRQAPDDIDASFNIAVGLIQLGRPKEALPLLLKVVALKPEHIQAHQNLGLLFRDARDYPRARHHLLRLAELDSTYSELVQREIRKCEEDEFLAQAGKQDVQGIAKAVSFADGGQLSLDEILGEALRLSLTGDLISALSLTDRVLRQTPTHSGARCLRGQVLLSLERRDEAIAEWSGLLQDEPDHAEARFLLGTVFLDLGDVDRALECFRRVKEIDPDYPLIDENIQNAENAR